MRILITGAQGFLGRELVTQFDNMNISVSQSGRRVEENVLVCDLTNPNEVKQLIDRTKPDRIIHCAALVPKSIEAYNDLTSVNKNSSMLISLLESSKCPIIFISSMTVYGSQYTLPVKECDCSRVDLSEYGTGKLKDELRLIKDGRQGFAIRLPGLFGLPRKSGLVYNVFSAYKSGNYPLLPESPSVWSAMHVKDAAKAIVILATSTLSDKFQALNLGYRGANSITYMIDLACDIYNVDRYYKVANPIFEYDLSKADMLKAVPKVSFLQALQRFGNEI